MGVSAAQGLDLGSKVKVGLLRRLSGCGQMILEVVSHKNCMKQPC